jgi:hypothetical protein
VIAIIADTQMPRGGRRFADRYAKLIGETEVVVVLGCGSGGLSFQHVWF